jgi:O-antigen/teichoic acid export membrane protein
MLGFIKKHLKKNKALIKDNLVLFLSIGFANLINYVFHFFVGRQLGPGEYGTFGVLLSVLYFIIIPLMALQTTLSKFVAELNVKEERGKLSYLFLKSFKKIGLLGLFIGLLFILVSPLLSKFLRIGSGVPLIIIGILMTFIFLIPVLRGFLQGLQRFKLLGLTFIIESITKIIIGVPLILLGFGVNGAVAGFVLSFFFPLAFVFYFIRKFFKEVHEKFNTSNIYKYSFPVLLMLLGLTGLYTIDVVLVKRFFNPVDAGFYAALSLFGKIMFFASMSISMVMFPKVSESSSRREDSRHLLLKSLIITLVIGGTGTLLYLFFPGLILGLLFGEEYLAVKNLLWLFGVFMTIYSLSHVISHYNIALHRTKFLYLLAFFNLLEILLIVLFHDTLMTVVMVMVVVMTLLFLSMLVYTLKNESINNNSGL